MTGRPDNGLADLLADQATMTCQEFEPFLFAYVDGEFDSADRVAADAHLAGCEHCRSEVEAQRAFKLRVREACAPGGEHPAAPAHLRAAIAGAIAQEPRPGRLAKLLRPRVVVPVAAAAAACLAVALWLRGVHQEEVNAVMAATLAYHQTDLPLDVRDVKMAQLREFLRGKVDFAPARIPELRAAALQVQGARLSNLNGRPAAYVVYGAPGQRRISLLVFDAPGLRLPGARRIADRDVMLANRRGYNVAVWKDDEIVYSLVSDLDEGDIAQLVAASGR